MASSVPPPPEPPVDYEMPHGGRVPPYTGENIPEVFSKNIPRGISGSGGPLPPPPTFDDSRSEGSSNSSSTSRGKDKVISRGKGERSSGKSNERGTPDFALTRCNGERGSGRSAERETPDSAVILRKQNQNGLDKTTVQNKDVGKVANGHLGRKDPGRRTVTKKTRVYMVDGVQVTSTTYHVMAEDGSHYKAKEDYDLRKQELQELKRLQREENRQFQELTLQIQEIRDQQEKKFAQERQNLSKGYDGELENLTRTQKRQLEDADRDQEDHLRMAIRKLKFEQQKGSAVPEQHAPLTHTLDGRLSFNPEWTMIKDIETRSISDTANISTHNSGSHNGFFPVAEHPNSSNEKDLKSFRDRLKQDEKLLKQEMDMLPKNQRKDTFKRRKEQLEVDSLDKERQFQEQLQRAFDQTIRRMQDSFKQKVALTEKQFLQKKHQMQRIAEAAMWSLEERQLQDRHQLYKQQLKDVFFLQRSQMLARHTKELEHVKRLNQRKEDEAVRAVAVEKKRLPKALRSETKTRTLMFKESLRISMVDPGDMTEKMRQFDEAEKRRVRVELAKQEAKHKRRLEQMRAQNEATVKELEHIQNEKRKMLLEHESVKLAQYDEEYATAVKEWKSQLKPRKQALESRFAQELAEQERFYAAELSNGDVNMLMQESNSNSALMPSPSPSNGSS